MRPPERGKGRRRGKKRGNRSGQDAISEREKILLEDNHQSAQGWNNRTLISHELVDSRFLVLPGSESTITEITE